jgi:hypothetical protein
MPNPHPGGLYPLTLPAWVALLVVKLPPALLSGAQSRTSPTTTTRLRHLWEASIEYCFCLFIVFMFSPNYHLYRAEDGMFHSVPDDFSNFMLANTESKFKIDGDKIFHCFREF